MSEGVAFRPMRLDDLDEVLRIEQAAFSHPWTRKLFSDSLDSYDCWVMFEGERQVGHGIIQVVAGEASLLNITIDPARQKRGLGLCLLEHLMRQALEQGAQECFLEVRQSNQVAYRLYERYGFNEVGRRRDYYPADGGREDALVMACMLSDEMAFS